MSNTAIVIVNWNTVELTVQCLLSLRENRVLKCCKVVVVDNASVDRSCEEIKTQFPEVELIENSRNVGFAAANNQVIEAVLRECSYALLLNSDTQVIGEVVQRSIAFMELHSAVGAMGCRVLNSDLTVQYTCSGFPTPIRLGLQLLGLDRIRWCSAFQGYRLATWERDSERDVEVISGCYMLVRTAVIEQIGLLDEEFFFFGEETDWCWRMREAGWQLRFSPIGSIVHHGGGSARKLNYRRDVLLSNAIVRFNLKNLGRYQAILAYTVLLAFNLTRCVLHSVISIWQPASRTRAAHFLNVVRRFRYAWPSHKSVDLMAI